VLNKGLGGTASAIMRVTLAMLANPLTWIILGVGALILVIDDLITYLNGGESAFGEFWGASIKYAKEAWDAVAKYSKIAIEWIQKVWNNIRNTTAFKIVEQAVMDLWGHIQNIYNLIAGVVVFLWGLLKSAINWFIAGMERAYDSVGGWGAVFENVADVISGVFEVVGGVISAVIGTVTMLWGGLVALFTGDTQILEQGWQAFCDGFSAVWDGAVNIAVGLINSLKDGFKALLAFFDIGTNTVSQWGEKLREALNVGRLIDWIKEKLKNLLPDWVLNLVGGGSEAKTAEDTKAETTHEGTKAETTHEGTKAETTHEGTKAETTQRVTQMDGWGYAPPVREIEKNAQVQKNTNIQAPADYKISQTFNVTTENPNLANALANQQAGSAVANLQGQDNARRANLAVQATSNG
jgi:phage-related protein